MIEGGSWMSRVSAERKAEGENSREGSRVCGEESIESMMEFNRMQE